MAGYSTYANLPNPNSSRSANAENGWGAYKWPGGVPGQLLGIAAYKGVSFTCRRELTTLGGLILAIAKEVHGYTVYTRNPNGDGEVWGPWGYENRAISGTSTASNHSKGRATDWNAPRNGYAPSFQKIESDFPPAMVRDIEACGWSWGGRYGDAMHWEYSWTPADVERHEAVARRILAGAGAGIGQGTTVKDPPATTEPTITDWWDEMSDTEKKQLLDDVAEIKRHLNHLFDNEVIPKDGKDPKNGIEPYTRSAASFFDIRNVPAAVQASLVGDRTLGFILAWMAQSMGLQVFGVVPEQNLYGVVAGDQFNAIAKRFGVTPDALAAANPQVTNRGDLSIGQVLVIPPK